MPTEIDNQRPHLRPGQDRLLTVDHLVVEFPVGKGTVHAVSDISFDVLRGETLGLVGESGCGKSSTGRAILQMPAPTSGSVRLDDVELTTVKPRQLRELRPRMQMVFQDPRSSLNPRQRVHHLVGRGLQLWDPSELRSDGDGDKVDRVLQRVGLDPEVVGERWPNQLSGGQAQRVSIARSLVLNPDLLICDEPVSALDVSVQAQILNILRDVREGFSLTMIFISHDLAVVRNMCDRIIVMYLGKVCEVGSADRIFDAPTHHYTRLLMDSVPEVEPRHGMRRRPPPERTATADLPSPLDPPSGCRFRTRCPRAEARCADEEPALTEVGADQYVACHFPLVVGRSVPTVEAGPVAS